MLLCDCTFLVSSYELRFCAFSDQLCRITHLKSVRFETPGSFEQVAWYSIKPSDNASWVAVQETINFEPARIRIFLRDGTEFSERKKHDVPADLLHEIMLRIYPPRHNSLQCKVRQRLAGIAEASIKAASARSSAP